MRSVADYLKRAAEFDTLAAAATVDLLRKRYHDIAACYRLLAKEREWLIGTGAVGGEQPTVQHPDVGATLSAVEQTNQSRSCSSPLDPLK